ncbi:hypothetical protein BFJ63_vAg14920 [Fusarium oxysporum f. sp. narcissi]|uniref:Uncharacterized protein n=1 Tax=Fusarium oxysporum f. sp. narcissi TaxID=451672 RepID=A0A4Q2VBC6_FUSOX|nr:hypothetical protein BFJ63_vAg14920 [Fusarium oxysporum f. sp. narcissi]
MTLIESILAVLANVPFLSPGPPVDVDKDAKKQKSPLNRFLGAPPKEKQGDNPPVSENCDQS